MLLLAVTFQRELVCCGKGACKACGGRRATHGPYWYAYFRESLTGKLRSRYVGKEWRELDERDVRVALGLEKRA